MKGSSLGHRDHQAKIYREAFGHVNANREFHTANKY